MMVEEVPLLFRQTNRQNRKEGKRERREGRGRRRKDSKWIGEGGRERGRKLLGFWLHFAGFPFLFVLLPVFVQLGKHTANKY
jgi:hypothetical protein